MLTRPPRTLTTAALLAALTLVTVASVAFGARDIAVTDALAALTGHSGTIDQAAATQRLPRTVLAVAVGAALAVAGTTMQAITRNPLPTRAYSGSCPARRWRWSSASRSSAWTTG